MIDYVMLGRLIVQTGSGKLNKLHSLLPLAQAIWNAAQAEEREECAKICENEVDEWADHGYELGAKDCAKVIRNRKT